MNHPGEIRTLVGIAEPEVRVWTNVGDAHLGFFASRGRDRRRQGGDPRAAPRPTDVLVANADDARVMARAPAFRRTRRDVRHRTARRRARQSRVEHARPRRHARATCARRPATFDVETPLLGAGNLRERPRGDGGRGARSTCRSTTIARARRDAAAGASPRRAAAAARRRHADRRLLQLQSGGAEARRSRPSPPRPAARARSPCSARCWSSATHARALHEECGRAAAAAGLELLIAVGGAPARALADAARGAGMPRSRRRTSRRATRPPTVGAAARPARRSRARQGLARHRHRRRRGAAEGGVRLMLYHLLYPLHDAARGAERDALHHVPHRRREPHGAGDRPVARARG